MEGDREMKELLQEEYWELEPQISPDGRYMAYQSDESGKGNIYVRPFPDVNGGKVAGLKQWWKQPAMVSGWQGAVLSQW